jgi:hypothetical protein
MVPGPIHAAWPVSVSVPAPPTEVLVRVALPRLAAPTLKVALAAVKFAAVNGPIRL